MTRQRAVLRQVVSILQREHIGCGIVLHGSVQGGYERPESDVDLFVITHAGDAMRFELDRIVEGVSVQVCFWPVAALDAAVQREPFLFGTLWRGEILHDADGLVQGFQAIVQAYFRDHPEVASAWQAQLAGIQRMKRAGYLWEGTWPTAPGGDLPIGWDQFARHLARIACARSGTNDVSKSEERQEWHRTRDNE